MVALGSCRKASCAILVDTFVVLDIGTSIFVCCFAISNVSLSL